MSHNEYIQKLMQCQTPSGEGWLCKKILEVIEEAEAAGESELLKLALDNVSKTEGYGLKTAFDVAKKMLNQRNKY